VLIDWFTVVAQIVNFLILVALLKYFLYDRVIRAMDAREEKVHSRLESAEKMKKESEEEAENYRRKNREIEEKRKELLDNAREEAEHQRKELTRQARSDVENLRSKWQESVHREKAAFLRELKKLAGQQVYALSRRALRDLADADLEERVAHVFVREMRHVKKEERQKMAEAIKADGNIATVRSGFEISDTRRQEITTAVHELISEDAEVKYKADPEIILGIELKSGGEKMAWSLEDYMRDLEDKTRSMLKREAREEDTDAVEEKKAKGDKGGRRGNGEG